MSSLSRDDLKKICGDNFPEWISFPAFEQVKISFSRTLVHIYFNDLKSIDKFLMWKGPN